jgi:hypothetical protein
VYWLQAAFLRVTDPRFGESKSVKPGQSSYEKAAGAKIEDEHEEDWKPGRAVIIMKTWRK